jgi:tetratricopeptide (TPR) repeat protein
MKIRDTQQNPNADLKNLADRLVVQKSPVRGPVEEADVTFRNELTRALENYRQGFYHEAEASLQKLITSLKQLMSTRSAGTASEVTQLSLLHATARSVLGRVRKYLGKNEQSQEDLRRAVEEFEFAIPKVDSPTGQYYSEYGVALYLINEIEKAISVLDQSISMGNICPEAYTYLAIHRKQHGQYDEAKGLLEKALALAPNDPLTLKALAELLETQKEFGEAVSNYQRAALALAMSNRFDEALSCLDDSLAISADFKSLSMKAEILRVMGRRDQSIEIINQALAMAPDYAFALGLKGQTLRELNQNEEAVKLLQRAVELDSTQDWVYSELAAALGALKRYDEAVSAADRALVLMPDSDFALAIKGRILRIQDQNGEAVALLQRAVELDPTQDWIHAELAAALNGAGRPDDSISASNQALTLNADNVLALMVKGEVLNAQGHKKEALEILDRVTTLLPQAAFFFALKGEILNSLGRKKEAVEALQQASALDPTSDRYLELASILTELGRNEDALQILDKALEHDAHNLELLIRKAVTLNLYDHYKESLELLDGPLLAPQDDPNVLMIRAEALYGLGRFEDSLELVDKLLLPGNVAQSSEDETTLLMIRTQILQSLARYPEALQTIEKVLSIRPDDVSALELKSQLLHANDDPEGALQTVEKVLSIKPDDISALDLKSQLLQAIDDQEGVIKVFDQLSKLDPKNIDYPRSKGYALLALGRQNEALEVFEQALRTYGKNLWLLIDKAVTNQIREDYEAAFKDVNLALEIDNKNSFALSLKGDILCDIGDFREAAKLLELATKYDPSDVDAFLSKGWALENLGKKHFEKARVAYAEGYRLDLENGRDNLWCQKGIGNALYLLAKKKEAKKEFAAVIAKLQLKPDLDADYLSLKGWCHYRLKEYDQAMRAFIDTLSLNSSYVSAQFDLALVMMCSEKYGLASRGYQQSLELTYTKPILRQRGLLFVAWDDLREAVQARLKLKEEAQPTLDMLKGAYDKACRDAQTPTSVGRIQS